MPAASNTKSRSKQVKTPRAQKPKKEKGIKKTRTSKKRETKSSKVTLDEINSTLDYYQKLFEGETFCWDSTNDLYIPQCFDPRQDPPEAKQKMIQYYNTYGFVVLKDRTTDTNPPVDEPNSIFTKTHTLSYWSQRHTAEINHHLRKVFNVANRPSGSTIGFDNSINEDAIIKSRAMPMKLNIGLINGTMYENSSNRVSVGTATEEDDNDEMMCDSKGAVSGNITAIDDSVSQSVPSWVLRASCLLPYADFRNALEPDEKNRESPNNLIASIEDSTCMFSTSSNLAKMQGDCLHFLPGSISERKSQRELRQLKAAAQTKTGDFPVDSIGQSADMEFSQYINYEERHKWPRGFLSTSNDNSSFSLIPGFHNIFTKLKKYMEDTHYGSKRTTTRAIPPPELGLDGACRVKRILLQEGDLLVYHPAFVTKLQANLSPTSHAYGLKVMFFNPELRGFTGFDYSSRRMATAYSYVNNDERVFGHTFFLKRRGATFLMDGTFVPKLNPLLVPHTLAVTLATNKKTVDADPLKDSLSDPILDLTRINSTLFYWARNIIDRHYSRNPPVHQIINTNL